MSLTRIILLIITVGIVAFFSNVLTSRGNKQEVAGTVYDFKMKTLEGGEIDFHAFKERYILIVNTASKCGYTPQYAGLEKLHEEYKDKLTVLGFPANNFLWQEPGSNEEIAQFCERNYGVTFQMFEKISVKGKDQAPLYRWLEAKTGKKPSWNFCKYLIDPTGNVIGFFPASVEPLSEEITGKIR